MKHAAVLLSLTPFLLFLSSCGDGSPSVRSYQEYEIFRPQGGTPPAGPMKGDLPPGHPALGGMPPLSSTGAAPQPSPVHWTLPAGWIEGPVTGDRVATLLIEGDETGASCAISVWDMKVGAQAQIERWGRQQLGLQSLDAVEVEPFSTDAGPANLIDFVPASKAENQERSLQVLMMRVGDKSLFVKFEGPVELLEGQGANFLSLCASIHPAHGPHSHEGEMESAE